MAELPQPDISLPAPVPPAPPRRPWALLIAPWPPLLLAALSWRLIREGAFPVDLIVALAGCGLGLLCGLAAYGSKKRAEVMLMTTLGAAFIAIGYIESGRAAIGARLKLPTVSGSESAGNLAQWASRAQKGGAVYGWVARRTIRAGLATKAGGRSSVAPALLAGLLDGEWAPASEVIAKSPVESAKVVVAALRELSKQGAKADAAWAAAADREKQLAQQAKAVERQEKWNEAAAAWRLAKALARTPTTYDPLIRTDELRDKSPVQLLVAEGGQWKPAQEVAGAKIGEDTVGLGSVPADQAATVQVSAAVRNNLPYPVTNVRVTFLVAYPLAPSNAPRSCGDVLVAAGPLGPGATQPIRPAVFVDTRGLAKGAVSIRDMLKHTGVADTSGFAYLDKPNLYVRLRVQYTRAG